MPVNASPMVLGTLGLAIIAVTLLWRGLGLPVIALSIFGAFYTGQLLTGARFKTVALWMRARKVESITIFKTDTGWWLSRVTTALLALPTPSMIGLLLARGVDVGWNPRTVLVVLLILLGLLALIHQSWYMLLVIAAAAATVAIVILEGSTQAQLGTVVAAAWLFLLGGLRFTIETAGDPHPQDGNTFAGILQRHTDIPAVLWMLGFLLVALAAAIAGSRWLLY